jgi:hypothetical protein
MSEDHREPAVAESYPTFWDSPPTPTLTRTVPPEEAYAAFVSLTEDDFPDDALPEE